MSLINYDRLLARLLSQEQELADELLTLSQQERTCCETDDADRLVDIVAQRKEVMSAWETHHRDMIAVAQSVKIADSPEKSELQNALNRLNDTIAAIQSQDKLILQKLTEKNSQDLSRLQSMNQGSRWLQQMNQPVQPFAYDSRQ